MDMPSDIVLWIVAGASLALGVFMFFWLRKQRQRRKTLLRVFSKLGTRNNLSFTGQEVLAGRMIGLDGLQKKLLVLENSPSGELQWYTINLEEVRHCSVHKTYRMAVPLTGGPWGVGEYVDKVELQFHLQNSDRPLSVPFYRARFNEVDQLPALEAKARGWNSFLCKMLPAQQNGRA